MGHAISKVFIILLMNDQWYKKRGSDQINLSLILQGFSLSVNPRQNLAVDGQLFVEMSEKDQGVLFISNKTFVG